MPHLSLSLLGPFQVTLDGQPATGFKSNKVRALLAYLAVEADRPHRCEVLAGLLWPDWPDRDSLSNLRYALSNLRRVIGDRKAEPPFLLITRDTLQFNPVSDYHLDATAFTEIVEANKTHSSTIDQLQQAIALYEAVIAERIGRLSQPLRAALRVASVEGEQFTAEVVARVRATDEREILGCLSGELDRKHHLIHAQSIMRMDGRLLSRYRFRHILFQKYLYNSLDEVERVHLHEQVGTALEGLYGSQQETATVADIAPQLAWHFQEARITEKAMHYLHQAGDRVVQLSAYQEAIAHLTRGLALLMTLPDSPERAQQELDLHLSLSRAWIAEIPSREWEKTITRAHESCQQLGKTSELCRVLGDLSIFHYVRAEYQKARQFGEEALSLAQQAGDPALVALEHWILGFILFALGKITIAHAHLEHVISFYEPQ